MSDHENQSNNKKVEPKLLVGTVPCMNPLINSLWGFIKGYSEQIAAMSGGEYTAYDIFNAIYFGGSFVYIGYLCDNPEDIEFAGKSVENTQLVIAKYITTKKEEGFVGFAVVRFEPKQAFIWQAYMATKYRKSNAFDRCLATVIENLEKIGVPEVSFASAREGWQERIEAMGFEEGVTIFRRKLNPEQKKPETLV